MAATPKTMKAVLLNTETSTLSLSKSHPIPSPKPTEHLIRMHASALTNGELTWSPFAHWPTLHIPTYDIAGTIVTSVPSSPFRPGDSIYGHIDAYSPGGACEYACAPPSFIAHKPANLSWTEAATIPMSLMTAYQGLFTQAELTPPSPSGPAHPNKGKRVLITAASGGVGIFAVQLAHLSGATVVGTCGPSNVEFVKSLGADEVVNYRETSIQAWSSALPESRTFDAILHCAADLTQRTMDDAATALREEGRLVSIVPGYREPEGGLPKGAKGWFFILESVGKQLEDVKGWIEKGDLKTVVDSEWELEQYEEAFERVGSGRARGKVVFKIQ